MKRMYINNSADYVLVPCFTTEIPSLLCINICVVLFSVQKTMKT